MYHINKNMIYITNKTIRNEKFLNNKIDINLFKN